MTCRAGNRGKYHGAAEKNMVSRTECWCAESKGIDRKENNTLLRCIERNNDFLAQWAGVRQINTVVN